MIGDLFIVDQDRDLFFAIEIAIGDRHLVKRSQDDRDREIFLAFFSNQPFAGKIFLKYQSLENEN